MKMRSSLYNAKPKERGDNGENQAQFEEEIMQENEAILGALGNTVKRMKASAGVLLEEAEAHNRLLETVGSAFSRASSGVNRSVQHIEGVMGRYGWRHTLLIGALVVFTVCSLYYLLH
ncbi:putative Qc-SNARE protein [Trypanosoma conorhini]|uniref:Putative Qc-SNARE protein n=1 Tax=Trypanosoma conorhini TaxID=83891 RepID=A0A422NHD6_9TRYP|nr:putative Qc-SNARE protein [Trypanosoma conorhini]RNF04882.1 putative Qc-SNARE protein [Trypanosoma conorhini]